MSEDESEPRIGQARGPYDIEELATPAEELANSHIDLGSVLVPVVQGGQINVGMTPDHRPEKVTLGTPFGQILVTAFAAPKTPGLWRESVRESSTSLRDEGAMVTIEDGHWGREVIAEVPDGVHRFIGVDGPRWMARCIASGPAETADQLAQLARAVFAETVIRRGKEPYPPRELLPLVLPPVLAEQVAAAQQQMFAEQPGADEASTGTEPDEAAATGSTQIPADAQQPWSQEAPEQWPPAYAEDDDTAGALDQVAQASVVSQSLPADPPAEEQHDEPEEDESSAAPRSAGSAMQRFRRRRKKG